MTIRAQLQRRVSNARSAGLGFWLLFAGGMLLIDDRAYRALVFIPFVGFAATVIYSLFFIRCPKCNAGLGALLSSFAKPNFCPGCGVSFDSRT